jgi:hypothetical protein
MYVELHMLGPFVMNGVVGEVDRTYVVTEDDARLVDVDVQLLKKIS